MSAIARTEVVLYALRDLLEGPRRDLILEPLELGPKLFGEEVRHDRQELADLDEQPLEPKDRRVDAPCVSLVNLSDAGVAPRLTEEARPEPRTRSSSR